MRTRHSRPVGASRPACRPLGGLLLALLGAPSLPAATAPPGKAAERMTGVSPARQSTAGPTAGRPPTNPSGPVQVTISTHAGWERSLTIDNGVVEAVVVPAVGRIMAFRFPGKPSPIWDDPSLHGRSPDPASTEWGNFGGDKTWPSPQAEWPKLTSRGWPPPVAFDSMPVEAAVRRESIVLRSAIDPHYGIRTERVVSLVPGQPVMRVVTTYEKIAGAAIETGVWIITQLRDPVMVVVPRPKPTLFAEGFNRQSDELPAGLKVTGNRVSLARDPSKSTKIGTDASALLWLGRDQALLIESTRQAGGRYPDQQSSAEVYTNPDPKAYVELEMLGPLQRLAPGDTLSQTNTYTLFHRSNSDPLADAARILNRP